MDLKDIDKAACRIIRDTADTVDGLWVIPVLFLAAARAGQMLELSERAWLKGCHAAWKDARFINTVMEGNGGTKAHKH